MRERVTEVEDVALRAIVRIAETHGRLERGAAANELLLRQFPQRLAGEQAGLHHLGKALAPLALGQSREERPVDPRADGPVEGADEVLALRQVDRRLSADRGVDLSDERRRNGD